MLSIEAARRGIGDTAADFWITRSTRGVLSKQVNSNGVKYSVLFSFGWRDTIIGLDWHPDIGMVNEGYNPAENEEAILDVMKEGRGTGEPWGRVNPLFLREQTGLNKQQVNYALNQLIAAGWVQKLTDGLYELVADPRDASS
jgi:hypothetical protein